MPVSTSEAAAGTTASSPRVPSSLSVSPPEGSLLPERRPPLFGDRSQLARERWREAPRDPDVALAVVELDGSPLANPCEQLARSVRNGEVDVLPERREDLGDLGPERVEPDAREPRDEDGAGDRRRRCLAIGRPEKVRLVERDDAGLVAGTELVEHELDSLAVLGEVRVRRVDDFEQHVSSRDLLE